MEANPPPDIRATGWLLRVRGLVDLAVEDEQGRHIGRLLGPLEETKEGQISQESPTGGYSFGQLRDEQVGGQRHLRWRRPMEDEASPFRNSQNLPNLFEVTIPGADYNPGQLYTTLFLSQPSVYTFRFFGQSLTAVDIYLTAFSEESKLDTIFFQGVPMSEHSRAEFRYATNDPSLPQLRVEDGEKGESREVSPIVLTASESEDTTPPRTTFKISDRQVILAASDDPEHIEGMEEHKGNQSSGVLATYYTTDAQSFSPYKEPFLLPEDTKILMAFSIDRNGNREYPGAVLPVLGVSRTQVRFRGAVSTSTVLPQMISIINLDPIPITGPLEWHASHDVSWLNLDKREGKTPGLLTISANTADLGPGTFSGTIAITSPAPEVLFARQEIAVQLEISQEPSAAAPQTPTE